MRAVQALVATMAAALLIGGVAPPALHAQGVPGVDPNTCLAKKNKCVSKKIAGLLKCREKCQKKPAKCGSEQSACEDKVRFKFERPDDPAKGCFAKVEAKQNLAKADSICTTTADTAAIEADVDTAVDGLLATLEGNPPPARCPASGQTTAYGPGTDGDVQAGVALSYTDNGDGTITDNVTGLMWEKKDNSGGIHDRDNQYTWCIDASPADTLCDNGTFDMDGTIVSTFLDTLNDVGGGGASCFAGYCDWRVPHVKELQSIIDYGVKDPAVDPAFHNFATCNGCTDVTVPACSCTSASISYWTSTTFLDFPDGAWAITFSDGRVEGRSKSDFRYVRAVRGGL